MPSVIPGYEYDLFISYRHKDNEYDGWVTEFVENLKRELHATFKEDISIYFDTNPHDGLLETHDVDDSLAKKLKCLLFIPIVSQTYCDPNCFAWKHEFIAFRNGATVDRFGLKVNLANRNVASRILPVRIHDLDHDDVTLFEKEVDAVMRPVDFIFKSPGVNRPLRANEDDPRENLNHTFYRDQINKVANAVKELISGIKSKHEGKEPSQVATASAVHQASTNQFETLSFFEELKRRNVLRAGLAYLVVALLTIQGMQMATYEFGLPSWMLTALLIVCAAVFPVAMIAAWYFEKSPRGIVRINSAAAYENPYTPTQKKPFTNNIIIGGLALTIVLMYFFPRNSKSNVRSADFSKSIAVLPFLNMSTDPEQDYFSDGMMDEILNQLVKVRELKVISRTSSMIYKDSKLPLKSIADELRVANVVQGSVRKSGNNLRISVQLIDASSDANLWSRTFDSNLIDIFSIQTEISKSIALELKAILTHEEEKELQQIPTKSNLAYDYYLKGQFYNKEYNWIKGIEMCSKAIEADPDFTLAYVLRSNLNALAFFNKQPTWEGRDEQAKIDLSKALELNASLPEVKMCQAFTLYYTERDYKGAIRILNEVQQIRPNDVQVYFALAIIQRRMGLWREALKNLELVVSMEPNNKDFLFQMARLYSVLRVYSKAIEYFDKVLSIDPEFNNTPLIKYHTLLAWKGDPEAAFNATQTDSDFEILEWYRKYYNRQFAELAEITEKSKVEIQEKSVSYEPKSLALEEVYYWNNNKALSKAYGDKAIELLEAKLKKTTNDFRVYAALGFAHAYVGNNKEAIQFAGKANEIMPLKLDQYLDGVFTEQNLVDIYIITGKYDLAMDKIESLLVVPGILSIPMLRIDPKYDKLHSLPRFKEILESEYITKY